MLLFLLRIVTTREMSRLAAAAAAPPVSLAVAMMAALAVASLVGGVGAAAGDETDPVFLRHGYGDVFEVPAGGSRFYQAVLAAASIDNTTRLAVQVCRGDCSRCVCGGWNGHVYLLFWCPNFRFQC